MGWMPVNFSIFPPILLLGLVWRFFKMERIEGARVSKFAVEDVFNSNATIVVLNSTKMTAINDNEKNLAINEEKRTSS